MERLPNLSKAQESLATITTLLLSPGAGSLKPGMTFYAHFLMRMNTVWTDKCPTAGVSITDKVNLYINPTFWNSLNSLAQMELLEHEIEHVVYMHPLRSKDYLGDDKKGHAKKHKRANISMDAGINEDKPNLCKDLGVTFQRLNEELKRIKSRFTVDKSEPWEITYEKLTQAAKENPEKGDGDGFGDPIDDHDIWSESTESREVAEGIIKDVANKAKNATGIGNMPQDMLREIENMNKASVNWKRELRQFFVNSLKYDFEKTRSRRNRRYGVVMPGRKKKPNLHIAVCLDSSGSVHDEAFSQFFAELGEISDMGIKITCIDCDSAVAAVYEFDKKKKPQRYGNGGTSYGPGIDKAKELGVDACIQFGDMDASDVPNSPGIPFIWAVVGNNLTPPGNFGKVIQITTERK